MDCEIWCHIKVWWVRKDTGFLSGTLQEEAFVWAASWCYKVMLHLGAHWQVQTHFALNKEIQKSCVQIYAERNVRGKSFTLVKGLCPCHFTKANHDNFSIRFSSQKERKLAWLTCLCPGRSSKGKEDAIPIDGSASYFTSTWTRD